MAAELFTKIQELIHKQYNTNFHFDKLDWPVQVWIINMCAIFQVELENIERSKNENRN